ncbi:MAG: TolC family protein, partial [Planctomycetota bacterium]
PRVLQEGEEGDELTDEEAEALLEELREELGLPPEEESAPPAQDDPTATTPEVGSGNTEDSSSTSLSEEPPVAPSVSGSGPEEVSSGTVPTESASPPAGSDSSAPAAAPSAPAGLNREVRNAEQDPSVTEIEAPPESVPEIAAASSPLRTPKQDPTVGPNEYRISLSEALDLAVGSNLTLELETITTDISRFNARGSWGAFDWLVSATGRYTDGEQQGSTSLAGADVLEFDSQQFEFDLSKPLRTGGNFAVNFNRDNTETNNQFQLVNPSTTDAISVQLTQPLLRRGWERFATADQRAAEMRLIQQRERERGIRQQLVQDVHNAYWDLVGAYEQLAVARSNVDLGVEQLDQNRRRLNAGVGTEVEVLQAQAEVASRTEALLAAQVAVRDAGDALKVLLFPRSDVEFWELRVVPTTPLPQPEQVTPNAAPPWADCLIQALEERADLRGQRLEIEAAEIEHGKSISERQVGLDLSLNASSGGFDGDAEEAFRTATEFDFPTYTAAVTFSSPIGNRTARYSERAAWANVRRAKLTYDQLEIAAAAEVRTAVRQVVYQAERVAAAAETLRLARRQLEAERARLAEGLSTNFVVLQFQQDLAVAESSERRARVDYMKALASLSSARGVIGE